MLTFKAHHVRYGWQNLVIDIFPQHLESFFELADFDHQPDDMHRQFCFLNRVIAGFLVPGQD